MSEAEAQTGNEENLSGADDSNGTGRCYVIVLHHSRTL